MAATQHSARDTTAAATRTDATTRRARLRLVALWTQIGAAALALLFVVVIAGVQRHERNQIRHGVYAFGVDLSGMTRAEARAALTQASAERAARPLELRAADNRWQLDGAQLGLTLDVDGALDDAWAAGRHGWGPSRLAALWRLRGGADDVGVDRVGVASDALDAEMATLAGAINQERVDPSLTVTPDTLATYVNARTGRSLDINASRAAILRALAEGNATLDLTVATDPPAAGDADYAPARAALRNILDAPIVLDANGQTWTLTPDQLAGHLSVTPPADGKPAAVQVDQVWVADVVTEIQVATDRLPRSPRLWWDANGQLVKTKDGTPGATLDGDKAGAMIMGAFLGEQAANTVTLPVSIQQPPALPDDLATLGIATALNASTTPYAGSVPQRAHNIELAAQLLNGTLILPGQTFSFNAELGSTSLEAGFQVAYGIANNNGSLSTVPSVAGGICQVATTVFQPVFWTGYAIDQRSTHSYWIANYAYNGYVGLDATVDEASGLDFKWTNDSPTAVLIEAVADGENFTVRLYGTPPPWRVEVDPPTVSNRVPADPQTVYQASDTLPDGEMRRVEHAEDGFDVKETRRVYEGDQVREYNYETSYGVSRNVVMVGSSTGELPADFVPPE